MAVVVAPVIGPTLGGYITDNFSWRWLFLINVPVAVLSLVLSARMLEDPPFLEEIAQEDVTVDYVGLGLLATGIGCLQVALDKGEREDWFCSSFIVSFSVIAVVALVSGDHLGISSSPSGAGHAPVQEPQFFGGLHHDVHAGRGALRRHGADPAAPANVDGLHRAAGRHGAVAGRAGHHRDHASDRAAARQDGRALADRVRF